MGLSPETQFLIGFGITTPPTPQVANATGLGLMFSAPGRSSRGVGCLPRSQSTRLEVWKGWGGRVTAGACLHSCNSTWPAALPRITPAGPLCSAWASEVQVTVGVCGGGGGGSPGRLDAEAWKSTPMFFPTIFSATLETLLCPLSWQQSLSTLHTAAYKPLRPPQEHQGSP